MPLFDRTMKIIAIKIQYSLVKLSFLKNISVWHKIDFLGGPALKILKFEYLEPLKVPYGTNTYYISFKMF